MENSLSGESFFSGFDVMKGVVNDEAQTELSMSPSEREKLFVEAVRKLSSYEHSLETLAKRFDKDGIQTRSEIQHSKTPEMNRNSDAFADNAPGRTDASAGGEHSVCRKERQTWGGDRQKDVKIQIPSRTAEIILRILKEDLEKTQRSALKQAESCLNGVTQSLVTVAKLLQSQLENCGRSQEPILIQTNEIADDMVTITDKLNEKLVEVQNLSESLLRAMEDETRLSMLVKRTVKTEVEALVSSRSLSWKELFANLFYGVASYFVARLLFK